MTTIDECFNNYCKPVIENHLQMLKNYPDKLIKEFTENEDQYTDSILNDICNYNYSDEECYRFVNNDKKIIKKMRKHLEDCGFEFESNIQTLLIDYAFDWLSGEICYEGTESIIYITITTELEKEYNKRRRERQELIKTTQLIINRTIIPNELTQHIILMLMMSEF